MITATTCFIFYCLIVLGIALAAIICDHKHVDITRIEVIETGNGVGRAYVKHNIVVTQQLLQDEGRTLKIFVKIP